MSERQSETRAETNASLGAERAAADGSIDRAARIERRVLDDFIERDRLRADERLLRFRARTDRLLALERLASPTRDRAMERERLLADLDKQAERDITDAALEHERHRSDEQVEEGRDQQASERSDRLARRGETDVKLGAERKHAEALLGCTSAALESARSERAFGQDVLAMVAHDLSSPLTVIACSAQVLLEDSHEPATREVAQDMVRSAARMGRLLADLLDVARIESETFQIVKEEHDVRELLREVLRSYAPLFADRHLDFTVAEPPSALLAPFDHDRVVQVLSNLLGNALKFTAPGGSVGLRVLLRPDGIELEVSDTGHGIAPEALLHVFDRFWQEEDNAHRGLGLGLYICQQIVKAHGGRIWCESLVGEGTTFRFTLPATG